MASKTGSRAPIGLQEKAISAQLAAKTNDHKSLPSEVSKTPKPKLVNPEQSAEPRSDQACTAQDLKVPDVRISEQTSIDQGKKSSGPGSGKISSVSAKFSDGANSLAKTNGIAKVTEDAEYIECGKSSMCRGSTSSDVSDESTVVPLAAASTSLTKQMICDVKQSELSEPEMVY